jgi:glycosyltransferase involved in cell wall biosynthesis
MRRRGCDIAHVCIYDELVPIIRTLSPRTRIVLHLHDHRQAHHEPEIARRLAQADAIVGCSAFVTENVRRAFPEIRDRCLTITNAVDIALFDQARERGARAAKRIVFVGRRSPEKGVHTLLEAFRRVLPEHPDAQLDVVGPRDVAPLHAVDPLRTDPRFDALLGFYARPTSYQDYLETLAEPMRNSVRFVDPVAHADTPRYLRDADVVVFPSIWDEPFGLPVLEAMAAARPVVATAVGGIRETVDDGLTGLLVPPGDAASLAAAIASLLEDEARRKTMGAAGRRRAEAQFSWPARVDEWMALYTNVVRASASGPPPGYSFGRPVRTGQSS